MQILVNGQELYTLTATQLKVLAHDINSDILEQDLKRRLKWVIDHEFNLAFQELKKVTLPKLQAAGYKTVPVNPDDYIREVIKLPEFKSLPESGEPFVVQANGEEILNYNQLKVNVFTIMGRTDSWKFMREKLQWILNEKCVETCKRIRAEWTPKFVAAGMTELPLDDYDFAILVFEQPDYKDRKAIDAENPL